jgi:hypothetical protein
MALGYVRLEMRDGENYLRLEVRDAIGLPEAGDESWCQAI